MEQSALRDLFYRRVGNTVLAVSNHLELHLPLFRFQNRTRDNVLRMWLYICARLLTSVYTRHFHTYIYTTSRKIKFNNVDSTWNVRNTRV